MFFCVLWFRTTGLLLGPCRQPNARAACPLRPHMRACIILTPLAFGGGQCDGDVFFVLGVGIWIFRFSLGVFFLYLRVLFCGGSFLRVFVGMFVSGVFVGFCGGVVDVCVVFVDCCEFCCLCF